MLALDFDRITDDLAVKFVFGTGANDLDTGCGRQYGALECCSHTAIEHDRISIFDRHEQQQTIEITAAWGTQRDIRLAAEVDLAMFHVDENIGSCKRSARANHKISIDAIDARFQGCHSLGWKIILAPITRG